MSYMLHNMIVFRSLILFPLADPLVITVVKIFGVNFFMINEIITYIHVLEYDCEAYLDLDALFYFLSLKVFIYSMSEWNFPVHAFSLKSLLYLYSWFFKNGNNFSILSFFNQ